MVTKRHTILILSIALVGFLAWIVMAAAGDGVKIVTPTSGTNYTSVIGRIFNVSFVNASDVTQPSNASFYLNISGSWIQIGNTSVSGGCTVGATASSCAANITNITIPDGVYSLNATIFNGSGKVSVNNAANLSTLITIDSTPPQVYSANFSGLSSGTNHSEASGGLFEINVSIIDVTIGVNHVFFNVTNSSGIQNSTITATREGTTSYYSATLNTTHYPEGTYNITVYANDSLNNLNNTGKVHSIIFDNTDPSASLSCTPNPVTQSGTLTCACDGSDSLSGISTESFTTNPSTGQTGTFTTYCTVTDRAGNSVEDSFDYTVEGQSSGGNNNNNGGNNGDTWVETFVVNNADFNSGHTRRLTEKRRLQVSIENENHYVGILDIANTTAVKISVTSTPQEKIFTIGQTEKFEVSGDNFYDLQVTLVSISGSSSTITIKALHEEIPATEQETQEETGSATSDSETSDEKSSGWIIFIIIALIVIAAVVVGIIYIRKGK